MLKNDLSGKVALVTGAARRIGAEIAKTLHANGMNIVLHYNLSEVDAVQLMSQLNKIREDSAICLRAELQDSESHKQFIQTAVKHWGRLDALVNNASRFYRTVFGASTDYAWEDLIGVNLKVPFFLSQCAHDYLTETNGCIVNISDIHAIQPLKDYGVYCISKSGLLMMTKVLAKEMGPAVRVNAISPGAIIWPEGENALSDGEKQKIIDKALLKRVGHPKDIANATLFLIRDADYMTGQVLTIDGGRMLTT